MKDYLRATGAAAVRARFTGLRGLVDFVWREEHGQGAEFAFHWVDHRAENLSTYPNELQAVLTEQQRFCPSCSPANPNASSFALGTSKIMGGASTPPGPAF